MPTTETFNPSRAAVQVGVPGSTLRHWAKTYGEFLSAGSNPEPGIDRRFTAADIETLKAVAQLRANGLQPEEIIARLRNNPATGLQESPESATSAGNVPQGENVQLAPLQSIVAVSVGKVDALGDKISELDRRIERMESQRTTIFIAIAAFAAGVALVAVVTWLLGMLH